MAMLAKYWELMLRELAAAQVFERRLVPHVLGGSAGIITMGMLMRISTTIKGGNAGMITMDLNSDRRM